MRKTKVLLINKVVLGGRKKPDDITRYFRYADDNLWVQKAGQNGGRFESLTIAFPGPSDIDYVEVQYIWALFTRHFFKLLMREVHEFCYDVFRFPPFKMVVSKAIS